MVTVSFRFYAELNDFLPSHGRHRRFVHVLNRRSSVKDAIEAVGVPHPEIDLILVNGTAVDFGTPLEDGAAVAVYPRFRSLDLGDLPRVGAPPPDPRRFIADIHLRKLASYLRLAGFDVIVIEDDAETGRVAARDGRIVLTRDRGLLKRSAISLGLWIRQTDPQAQFADVVACFDLASSAVPFTRCLCCNGLLQEVPKNAVAARLPARTRAAFDEFHLCLGCGRVYWRGSHYDRLAHLLRRLLAV